ncbi:MAG TPA: DUF4019 domain-containing protein [Kiritimatiellia bacterium]|mgnify:CR=1 FL=1|nr:DUF4019 domain-containing protein [Kiritimatiellia bacterium]HNR93541.1 DUF4019 domain-containing protein [Kiritimatiellia bacterium]HNS81539.1 DUF4019 domain-containing protein [Kiritimatiellia bacterium]HPA78338.1 DUF4019 domain-containing protein [Kiritimatiellia bacterium]HQQ04432.1 DUF4019 domain-containing protein [Kiritimatiellia bacterium]
MKNMMVTLALILLAGCARPRHPEEAAAMYAAQAWLQEVDSGAYAASWSNAAAYFQGAVAESDWAGMMTSGRAPLGEIISRDFKSARHFTSLPGVPDGDYIVIQFKTSFARKKNAVETVTPMKEDDGEWRVSGYFVK